MSSFFTFDKRVQHAAAEAERLCGPYFARIEDTYEYNQGKVLDAFRKGRVAESHFLSLIHISRGLMPNPKAGTVTPDVARAVTEAKTGKIGYRLDKTNIIHCPIGKVSFGPEKLSENFDALMGAIMKAKPAAAKGQYVKSCVCHLYTSRCV